MRESQQKPDCNLQGLRRIRVFLGGGEFGSSSMSVFGRRSNLQNAIGPLDRL